VNKLCRDKYEKLTDKYLMLAKKELDKAKIYQTSRTVNFWEFYERYMYYMSVYNRLAEEYLFWLNLGEK